MLATTQSTITIVVAVITAAGLITAALVTAWLQRTVAKADNVNKRTESLQQGLSDLVDQLQEERAELQGQVASLRQEVREAKVESAHNRSEINLMKAQQRETETALIQCRQSEAQLRAEIAELREAG